MATFLIIILILIIIYAFVNSNKRSSVKSVSQKVQSLPKQEFKNYEVVDIKDMILDYEYLANIWRPTTSLEAVNHHGDIIRNVKERDLPIIGKGTGDGIWLPISEYFAESHKPKITELRDIEFLKKFRGTYESNLSHEEKFEIISALLEKYKDLPIQNKTADWYLWELIEVPGISASISEALYYKGIKTKSDIKVSSDEFLINISGIGLGRLKQIRDYFSDSIPKEKLQIRNDIQSEPSYKKTNDRNLSVSEIDISRAKRIFLPQLNYEKSQESFGSVNQDLEKDFTIDSETITLSNDVKKPRGLKFEFIGNTSVQKLKSLSDFIPESLPHIQFDVKGIRYNENTSIPGIPNNTYRFRESSKLNVFLSSSKELIIHLYNWNLELLGLFNANDIAQTHTHLRKIELSTDLSCFLFTNIDKAYLLDSKMNLKDIFQVPNKDGFEKRKVESVPNDNGKFKECLGILNLPEKPSKDEIKVAFRKLVLKWHPDKNPDIPEATEKTRQLIQAYEYLTGEEAQKAFEGISKDDYYWVDLSRSMQFESGGMTLSITFSIGTGDDWIYGAGLSDDGSRIYLGCYSGKIYQINQSGRAEKIYIIPEEKYESSGIEYNRTNPSSFITEYNNRKYIFSEWYLYILNEDNVMKYLKNENGKFILFEKGFILKEKKKITLFDKDGQLMGSISVTSPITNLCYKDNLLLIESTTKAYTFNLNLN